MVQADYSQMFKCPKCDQNGVIFVVKAAGNILVIKSRCPKHGDKVLKLPLAQKPLYISYIQDGVFRCFKCGIKANIESMKAAGPWILARMTCEVHGNSLPFQKIWSSIYNEISGAHPVAPRTSITTNISSTEKVKVIIDVPPECPYCKAPINRDNAKWSGPITLICPYCSRTVQAIEKQI